MIAKIAELEKEKQGLEKENQRLEKKNKSLFEENGEPKEKLSIEEGKNAVYYGREGLKDILFDIVEKNSEMEIEAIRYKKNEMKKDVIMGLKKFFKD
ncbi:unnamed protein product [Trifolium pratense]|uniref:Uncharacterized protein n=1 Tax=Trifolium pratense TaxID=57577 RepID=A0ACB0IAE9_TRIPR|nr:unnamed protein product [Trifolium pratense]